MKKKSINPRTDLERRQGLVFNFLLVVVTFFFLWFVIGAFQPAEGSLLI